MAMPDGPSRRRVLGLLGGAAAGGAVLAAGCASRPRPAGPPRLGLLQYVRAPAPDAARRGFLEALGRGGFPPGIGVVLLERFAAGSMATCRAQVGELLASGADMLVAIGTPPLEAILSVAPARLPVVFCYCSNPWGAGAGASYTEHRPNVVGSVSTSPLAAELDLARTITTDLSTVGLVFNPSEANASFEAELLRREASERSLTVLIEPVAGPAEVPRAAERLAGLGVGALVRVGDYATSVGFASLAAVGLRQRLPVYSVDPSDIATAGCLAVVGWDAVEDGALAGALAVKVLRGRSPSALPFEAVERKVLLLNRRTARAIGVRFPPLLLRQAGGVLG
ncbi:MAG: ABC transporter substrate-binding protein [Cyanobium sp. CACIAM 14]|nr:MAG: ABC transporter substrate-binding protein [Cyanobium sp. CACIAM 14]